MSQTSASPFSSFINSKKFGVLALNGSLTFFVAILTCSFVLAPLKNENSALKQKLDVILTKPQYHSFEEEAKLIHQKEAYEANHDRLLANPLAQLENHGVVEYEVIEQVSPKDYPVGTIEHTVYVTWHEWFQISN